MAKKPAPQKFIEWLTGQMEANNLGIRETAKKVGVSHPTISEMVTYGNMPSYETCVALAKAFNVPPLQVLQLAGMMPSSITEREAKLLELDHLYANATEEQRDRILEYIRFITKDNPAPLTAPSAARLNPKTQPR